MPNSEIAAHEALVQQLKADIGAHNPPTGDTQNLTNWAALNHKMNGYLLRWGQFKLQQASDWWWGDDDEAAFSALKVEYNQIRSDFIAYAKGLTKAPPAEAVSPGLVEEEAAAQKEGPVGQQLLDTARGLIWFGAIGVVAYYFVPLMIPRIATALASR